MGKLQVAIILSCVFAHNYRKVDEFQNYSDMDSMLQYCKDVQTVQRRLTEIQEQVNQINKVSPCGSCVWQTTCKFSQ